MAGSTIATTLTISVTLGTGSYPNPLTIASTGGIAPTSYYQNSLYGTIASGYVLNQGLIEGGTGITGVNSYAANGSLGGNGVLLDGSSLTNSGTIIGGAGGTAAGEAGTGGTGGYGIDLRSNVLSNSGVITGGAGGVGGPPGIISLGRGGTGGIAVVLAPSHIRAAPNGSTLINTGTITGGRLGSVDGTIFGGNGGAGVAMASPEYPGTPASLTNSGTIAGGYGEYAGVGVSIYKGDLTNHGLIVGGGGIYNGGTGVFIENDGAVLNTGLIEGGGGQRENGGAGLDLYLAGSVTNTGTITGGSGGSGSNYGSNGGIGLFLAHGIVTNSGTIEGGAAPGPGSAGAAVEMLSGTLINDGTILGGAAGATALAAGAGVSFRQGDSTLINAGYIGGGRLTNGGSIPAADAVNFGTAVARLVLDPGASFGGAVVANPSVRNVLELASASADGSIAGIGSSITGFGTVTFDAGASWLLSGTTLGIAGGQTFSSFAGSDVIQITDVTGETIQGFANGTLTLGGSTPLSLLFASPASTNFVAQTDTSSTATDISLLCYAEGTLILTPSGERPIETLRAGDAVMTQEGDGLVPRQIKWVGCRSIDLTRHPRPEKVAPIRIRMGALAPQLPRRDLIVSPNHALFIDEALYPARLLVNGLTIVRDLTLLRITYHHVELDQHALLQAEGVAAETYLDTGDRAFFGNAGTLIGLHPARHLDNGDRYRTRNVAALWEAYGCAPLVVTGAPLKAVQARLHQRAIAMATRAQPTRSAADSRAA